MAARITRSLLFLVISRRGGEDLTQGWGAREESREWGMKDQGLPLYRNQPQGCQNDQQEGGGDQGYRHVEDNAVEEAALTGIMMSIHATQREVGPQRTQQEEGRG